MTPFKKSILEGRTALVTGGGSGIGKEIAVTLGRHGAGIVIAGRQQKRLEAACLEFDSQGIECLPIPADVRDPDQVETVVSGALNHFGRLDIVVNNAAGNFPALLDGISYNGFKSIVDIDLIGTFNVTKAAFNGYLKANGGCIVNISAPFEHWGVSYQAHVAAAKSGVDSLTRTCAVEWCPLGIRVNSVAPGAIAGTEGVRRFETAVGRGGKQVTGTARDVANAVLFLVSDGAAFINGICMRVDGGSGIDLMKIDTSR